MAIVLDIIVLAIIGVSVFFAYKKGLIKTLFSLVGGLVAVVLAVSLSSPVANWLNEKFVGPAVRNSILTAVNGSAISQSYDDALNSVDVVDKLQEMPEELRSFLGKLNVNIDDVMDAAKKTKADTIAAKEALIDSIAQPISDAVSKTIALIGLAIIFFIVLLVATNLLDAVFRVLPLAKTINKTGGIIFGVIRALLLVMVFGAVVYGLSGGNILISREQVNDTIILKVINEMNPVLNILNLR